MKGQLKLPKLRRGGGVSQDILMYQVPGPTGYLKQAGAAAPGCTVTENLGKGSDC